MTLPVPAGRRGAQGSLEPTSLCAGWLRPPGKKCAAQCKHCRNQLVRINGRKSLQVCLSFLAGAGKHPVVQCRTDERTHLLARRYHGTRPEQQRPTGERGMGVDSVALLVRWIINPSTRNFPLEHLVVVSAMTGEEHPQTREYMDIGNPGYQNLRSSLSLYCPSGAPVQELSVGTVGLGRCAVVSPAGAAAFDEHNVAPGPASTRRRWDGAKNRCSTSVTAVFGLAVGCWERMVPSRRLRVLWRSLTFIQRKSSTVRPG